MHKNTYPGKFIVFEGLDGSGQSTQSKLLKDFLSERGILVHETKEPTANLIGGLIKGQLTHDWTSSPECLQLLFAADRAHHLEKEIIPLLQRGITVISDRYFFSTIAFGASLIDDWDWLIEINDKFLLPDIVFFIKVSPHICLERIRKNRFGVELFETEESLTKVMANYERLVKQFQEIAVLIDGEQPVAEVSRSIIKEMTVRTEFQKWQTSLL